MLSLDPKVAPTRDIHRFLLGGVAPRPIALVSTVSKKGIRNLAPFSFFNAFSANPPIVVFSPGRRLRNATIKDTYTNLNETGECVIHAVTYSMTQQMNLTSAEFDSEVDEFIKSGFTTLPSETVTPPRV
ncbi:MAG: flavin reductase family protein, partial [candidate division Zixibacteria bacterium]|nr:flavin reductase family protein [candidate division Zixibacteria bacterium]